MTRIQKREILKKYKYILIEIDRLLEEKAQWRARAEKIIPAYSTVASSSNINNLEIKTVEDKIQEIDKLLICKINKQIKLQKYIENCIDNLDIDKHKAILKYRYINLYTYEHIAEKLGYSNERYIRKLEVQALNKVIF